MNDNNPALEDAFAALEIARMEDQEWVAAVALAREMAEKIVTGRFGNLIPRSIVCEMLAAVATALSDAEYERIPKDVLPNQDDDILAYLDARCAYREKLELQAVEKAIAKSRTIFVRDFKEAEQ